MFLECRGGGNVLLVMGPHSGIGQSMHHEKETLPLSLDFPGGMLGHKDYNSMNFSAMLLKCYERQHLSVTEEQCPERRAEPEPETADDSLRQRGATVRS